MPRLGSGGGNSGNGNRQIDEWVSLDKKNLGLAGAESEFLEQGTYGTII